MRRSSTLVFVASMVVLVVGSDAEANLTNTCYLQVQNADPSVPWFEPTTTVPVYLSTAGGVTRCNGQDYSLIDNTGLSQAQLEYGIQQAISIWNEESGSSLKLKYIGLSSDCSLQVANAVLLYGTDARCDNVEANSIPIINAAHRFDHGDIEFRKAISVNSSDCSIPTNWTVSPYDSDGYVTEDFVRILVHELGHTVYAMGHFDGMTCPLENSVMNYLDETRALTNVDREVAQTRYSPRANWSALYKARGVNPWTNQMRVNGDWYPVYKRPLYRMGSISNQIGIRVLGWVYSPVANPEVVAGGGGSLSSSQYHAGMPNWNVYSDAAETMGEPVAVATKLNALQMIIVYLKLNQSTMYADSTGTLCYRFSTNDGASFGSETCTSQTTNAYGLSAGYDPSTNVFIIGFTSRIYINEGAQPGQLELLTVPGSGSSTPSAVTSMTYGGAPVPSVVGPSVACAGTSACVMAYQTTSGVLGWLTFHIDPTTGAAVVDSSRSQAVTYVYDTPSVVYDCSHYVYRLAITQTSEAIYSYSTPATNPTTWTGTGDVWNDSSTFVSTGILGVDNANCGGTHGWYVRYF